MAKPTPWKDQYTLLCESCGYILENLDQSLPCPECGKPITESLPERRIGTPWQRKRNYRSLIQTWWMTLRHPIQTFDIMHVGRGVSDFGTVHSLRVTAIITFILVFTLNFAFYSNGKWIVSSMFVVVFALIIGISGIAIGFVLTAIEQVGLKAIGKARGYRITEQSAQAIVNHACVGWSLLGIAMGVGLLLKFHAFTIYGQSYTTSTEYAFMDLLHKWGNIIMLAGAIPGFLIFETFAYLGLRRCKYANTLPPLKNEIRPPIV